MMDSTNMPNWCDNEINFYANSKEEMDRLLDFIRGEVLVQDSMSGEHHYEETEFCFNAIKPQPRDIGEGWYDWRLDNWGTKWEPGIECFDLVSDEWLSVELTTAWSPPEGIYEAIQKEFPDVCIDWFFKEPGMKIAGWLDT
jgi:hypothetical protein